MDIICKNVLRMQHQPEACASDLGDGSHVTCDLIETFKIVNGKYGINPDS